MTDQPWQADYTAAGRSVFQRPIGERLRDHARRVGAEWAAATDPTAHLQYELLRQFLTVAEAAMDDAHVPPFVVDQVLDRLIYGCVPNPVEVAERERLLKRMAEDFARGPRAIVVSMPGKPSPEPTKGSS